MKKLPKAFKRRWVEALRSGKFKQGKRELYIPQLDTYCCLGVACIVAGVGKEKISGGTITKEYRFRKVPSQIKGDTFINETVDKLTTMNDSFSKPKGFRAIANWIEKNL